MNYIEAAKRIAAGDVATVKTLPQETVNKAVSYIIFYGSQPDRDLSYFIRKLLEEVNKK